MIIHDVVIHFGNREPTVCGQLMFALDKEADIGVALDLLSCTHDGSAATRNSKRAMVYLPSQFRLLTMCELVAHSNNLEGIDALLGMVFCL